MWGHVLDYYLFAYLVMIACMLRGAPAVTAAIAGSLVATVVVVTSIVVG